MMVREPIVAGRFYEAGAERCRAAVVDLLSRAGEAFTTEKTIYGGLVPHAGWVCSGVVAARVFQAIRRQGLPRTIVLFGGVHRYRGREAALFGGGRWETPLGPVEIDSRLAERILGHTSLIIEDAYAHEDEHSLEVQVPFIKYLFPETRIVPIMVPSLATADEVGEAVGRTLKAYNSEAVVVGTTDLTHYGPNYGFIPEGVGAKGNRWAKEVNDRRFIDLVCRMQCETLVAEAVEKKNACSSGAAAATLATARTLGAACGVLLEHTTSSEVLTGLSNETMTDSVGYAGIVFV
ncbi:MAG: AmmeMemoRadiSam system protein B [Planctomycetota bacterium]